MIRNKAWEQREKKNKTHLLAQDDKNSLYKALRYKSKTKHVWALGRALTKKSKHQIFCFMDKRLISHGMGMVF